MGDLQSHRKMFNLIRNTFPDVTVSTYTVAVSVSFLLHITFNSHSSPCFLCCLILRNSSLLEAGLNILVMTRSYSVTIKERFYEEPEESFI